MKNINSKFISLLKVVISIVGFFIIMSLLQHFKFSIFFSFENLPNYKQIIKSACALLGNSEFYSDLLITTFRVYISFIISVIVAIPLAFLISQVSFFYDYLYPIMELIRPIPNAAWIPLSILLIQSINGSMIFIIFISFFFTNIY